MNNMDYEKILKEAPVDEPQRQQYFMELCKNIVADKAQKKGSPLTVCIKTFGCQMNAKDSEKLLGIMEYIGYQSIESEEADFVLYNTCTIRDNANTRVYGRLGFLNNLKKKNPCMQIALCGCMMQEPAVIDRLKKSYRFVDLVFGTHNVYKLAELVFEKFNNKHMVVDILDSTELIVEDLPAERKYFFKCGVNIMYGCNNYCTFCIVPYVRGRERSRRPEEIIEEVKKLANDGVVEVMLLGQNVNSYGKNLPTPLSFAKLLQMVEEVEGIERIRFMTSHPKDLSDELIEVMKNSKKICRHLHLPLQSGSSRLLKKMNRSYTKESYLLLVDKLKAAMPDLALTTDIIVGFPGETEEDFLETMEVVKKVQYHSAFTFIYSPRRGTPAAAMTDRVPKDVVQKRFDALLKEVQTIASRQCSKDVGKTVPALIEEPNEREADLISARLDNNMMVHLKGETSEIGTLIDVKLTKSKGFYYMGERVRERASVSSGT